MTRSDRTRRDYGPVTAAVRALPAEMPFGERLRAVVDSIWEHHGGQGAGRGVSWVGFYRCEPEAGEMVLEVCRDRPACSPIGLHGACGESWRRGESLAVADVAALGEGYIACDPRDRSEVVVPVLRADGTCWGVLDLDSHEVGGLGAEDAKRLGEVLVAAGVVEPGRAPEVRVVEAPGA